MCEILPFPQVRRRGFIRRVAGQVASRPRTTGEKHLAVQVDVQRATLLRKGIPPEAVDREMVALEGAIRAELWSLVLRGEQA